MKAMPQSAKALTLARKFYESALRLESGYLGAVLSLADLHVIEGRNADAISLLQRYLNNWADDSLHTKQAQVFAASNMLTEALSHYAEALRGWILMPLMMMKIMKLKMLKIQKKGNFYERNPVSQPSACWGRSTRYHMWDHTILSKDACMRSNLEWLRMVWTSNQSFNSRASSWLKLVHLISTWFCKLMNWTWAGCRTSKSEYEECVFGLQLN
ncbi:Anaphase-promoting complex subunit 7 [Nymphaea thermarum]|nr:Anaphase-promoting complex subunit 7 [Nymphaea thermarum]